MRLIAADALKMLGWEDANDAAFDINNAPTIDAVGLGYLLKQLYREHSRLSRVDKDFEARMAGYNPSSFTAGFIYALERMGGWATSLEAGRKEAWNRRVNNG